MGGVFLPVGGGGYANSGQAYIGVAGWFKAANNLREYAGVELTTTLIPSKRYNVVFYVSMLDSSWYVVKNIGAYFSTGQPPANTNVILGYEPQVKYTGDYFTKEDWTKVEGNFIAQGGEDFITIGNFDNDTETDTLFTGGAVFRPAQPDYWTNAGFFIDDVSVTLDTVTGIEEVERRAMEIYPNPANNNLTIELILDKDETASIKLWTITGTLAQTDLLHSGKTNIDISELHSGIYFYTIFINGMQMQTGKQVIVK